MSTLAIPLHFLCEDHRDAEAGTVLDDCWRCAIRLTLWASLDLDSQLAYTKANPPHPISAGQRPPGALKPCPGQTTCCSDTGVCWHASKSDLIATPAGPTRRNAYSMANIPRNLHVAIRNPSMLLGRYNEDEREMIRLYREKARMGILDVREEGKGE